MQTDFLRKLRAETKETQELTGIPDVAWECSPGRTRRKPPPLIVCTHAQTPEQILAEKTIPEDELARCREIGAALAAGVTMGGF